MVVDKKTMVITVTVAAQNPRVALKLSEVLIDRLQSYVTDYRTGKSRHRIDGLISLNLLRLTPHKKS